MMKKTKIKYALMGAIGLVSIVLVLNAQAGSGLCFVDPAFGNEWEINLISCNGNDCSLELDRPGFPTIPLPSAGALTVTGTEFVASWSTAFGGSTQGTIHIACRVDLSNGIPASGPGMEQRIANFSPPPGIEFFPGNCELRACTAALGTGVDPLTQQ
jgi:hypothetical protein